MAERRFGSKMLLPFGGLLVWAAHFMFVYSANALACARGFADVMILRTGIVPLTVAAATLAALVGSGYLLTLALSWGGPLRGEDENDASAAFLRQVTVALTLLSIIAILFSALPSLIVPPCG